MRTTTALSRCILVASLMLAAGACADESSLRSRQNRSAFPETNRMQGPPADMRGGGDMAGKGRGGEHKFARTR